MEIKIKQTTEISIDIQIPSYWKLSCHTYKIISENKAIAICDLRGNESIGIISSYIPFSCGNPIAISEQEFNDKFKKVLAEIRFIT